MATMWAGGFQRSDNAHLMFRRYLGKDGTAFRFLRKVRVGQSVDLRATQTV